MRLTELFLEPMISTGEERSQFEDILSRLGGLLERQHAEQVVDQAQVFFYLNGSLTRNSCYSICIFMLPTDSLWQIVIQSEQIYQSPFTRLSYSQ